ncbi:MAG: preprotein translocase subunit SecG [Caulobacteraceae bacterium]
MELVVLSIHLLVCICLIGLVLLQRSEGGALGMGGGGGGSLMTGRGAADALARMTSVAGGFFLVTSLGLTMLSGAGDANAGRSVIDLIPQQSAPATPTPTTPAPVPETQPEESRPDPTESRAPSSTQLVSIGPRDASAATPSPSAATTRAGPVTQRATTTASTTPRQTPAPATQRATTPAGTQPRTTAPATQRSTPATTPARSNPPPATSTNGAVNGIDLTTDPQLDPESSDAAAGVVRRERAGPDQ